MLGNYPHRIVGFLIIAIFLPSEFGYPFHDWS